MRERFTALAFPATKVSIENCLRPSDMDIVPKAEDLLAEKGNTSGERAHCVLMLILPTVKERTSTRPALESTSVVKIAACWPYGYKHE